MFFLKQGWDEVSDNGLAHVSFTNFNTTSFSMRQIIYGFDLTAEKGMIVYNNTLH